MFPFASVNKHTSTIATFERDTVFQSNRYPNNASPNTSDLPPVRECGPEKLHSIFQICDRHTKVYFHKYIHTHISDSTLSILSNVYTTLTHPPDGTHNSGSQFRQPLVLILLCVIAIGVCVCSLPVSKLSQCVILPRV